MPKGITQVRRREYTRQFYRGNRVRFLLALLQTGFLTACNLLVSLLMQLLIDSAAGDGSAWDLGQLLGIAAVALALLVTAYGLAYASVPRFVARAIGQYKNYVFQKLSAKSMAAFSGENTSLYISALSNDSNTIEKDYLNNIFALITDLLMFSGALGLMLWYSPLLTAVSIGLSALPVVVSVLIGNRAAEAEKAVSRCNESYMSTLKDSLTGFSVVKSFRAEAQMCRLFAERIREVTDAKCRSRKILILVQAVADLAGSIAQIGVFLIGTWMAVSGRGVSAGVVMVFVQLMNYVIRPIGTVPQYLAQWKAANALIDKVADALEQNVREEGDAMEPSLHSGIKVENVTFSYDGEKNALAGVNAFFEAGKRYAVVGGSGSGKSTLLNLLMAGYSNYEGRILLDDRELRTVAGSSLYELMSMVQQNVFVFNASIRDNITMFHEFPPEEVDRAIRLSGLSELIAARGEGYLCGENGSGLSGGEKQRISVARALLRRSPVLLVDEATAALDTKTAAQVMNSILDLEDLTRIVVTHDLEEPLLRRYDCIFAMKNGKLCESGTFDELMAKRGYFYSLFTVSQ